MTVPELPNVTLIAVTGVAVDATAEALAASLKQAAFGHALLLSHTPPSRGLDPHIERRPIEPLCSRAGYSRFMLHRLHEYVTTSHALCVQWDGFAINGGGWDPEFLDYDYVGPVWPHFTDGHNVGNGGFSLRSRKLLLATRSLPYDGRSAEDLLIGRTYRKSLEREGIRFAPEAVARRFAYERTAPTGHEFGFHGAFNLVNFRSLDELLNLLKTLERQVLNHDEHKELLRWAVSRGYFKLAFQLVRRILRQHLATI